MLTLNLHIDNLVQLKFSEDSNSKISSQNFIGFFENIKTLPPNYLENLYKKIEQGNAKMFGELGSFRYKNLQ